MCRDQKASGTLSGPEVFLLAVFKVLVPIPLALFCFFVGIAVSVMLDASDFGSWGHYRDGPALCVFLSMIGLFFPWFIGPLSRLVIPPLRKLSYSSRRIEEWLRIFSVLYFLASCLGLLFILAPLTQHPKKRSAADRRNAKLAIEWVRGKENASNPNAEPAAVDTHPVAVLEELGAAIEQDAIGNVVKVNCHRNEKITDGDLVHLKGLTKLQTLRLSYTQVTDAGLVHLKGLTNLRLLDLKETQITDAGLINLQEFTDLEWLYLNEPLVTDAGLVHLKGLTNLKTLSLSYTEVTDTGLVHLKGLTNLESLYLGHTKVTDVGVAELQKALPNCDITK